MSDEHKLHDSDTVTEADQLRRTARRFEAMGMSTSAILFRNAAFIAENGAEWLDLMKLDMKPCDTEVRRTKGEVAS